MCTVGYFRPLRHQSGPLRELVASVGTLPLRWHGVTAALRHGLRIWLHMVHVRAHDDVLTGSRRTTTWHILRLDASADRRLPYRHVARAAIVHGVHLPRIRAHNGTVGEGAIKAGQETRVVHQVNCLERVHQVRVRVRLQMQSLRWV